MEDKLNSILYNFRDKVFVVLKATATTNSLLSFFTLIYLYGFYLEPDDVLTVIDFFAFLFSFFAVSYSLRVLFAIDRLEYIIDTWIECLLIIFVITHGFANYVFDVKILMLFLDSSKAAEAFESYKDIQSVFLLILVILELAKGSSILNKIDLKPATTFILSFVILIGAGAALLMLPTMTVGRGSMPFVDALFTSASAACVTGLSVQDTSVYFTVKGQVVIMIVIQLGGIGIVSFATFFATFLSSGLGMKHQAIMQDFLGSETLSSAKGFLRKVIFITLLVEFIGFLGIFFSWHEELKFESFGQKVFVSAFHSISAFCNAGFSLYSDGLHTDQQFIDPVTNASIEINIRDMYQLHFVIALIIIMGGIGYNTVEDVCSPSRIMQRLKHPWKRWDLGTRITLYSTGLLLAIGLVGFMVLEREQLADRTIVEALNTSFFQSVTTRTAGFNTMNIGQLQTGTLLLCIFLMFIGAAPGSTAGGIKCTTFVIIILSSIANIRGQKSIIMGKRAIPQELISKAFSVFMFAVSYNFFAIFLLTMTEPKETPILAIVFEQVSAFATVGLSMGITSGLTVWGKLIITMSMFLGRVGTLTFALVFSKTVESNDFKYPDANIMVG